MFNLLGSICSIIALLIVLCAEYQWTRAVTIVSAFLITFGLLGWLFRYVINGFQKVNEDVRMAWPSKMFWIMVGIILAILIIIYTFHLSYYIAEGIIEIITSTIESLSKR